MDEAAGQARIALAKQSTLKRAQREAALAKHSASMNSLIDNAGQRTDDDITDEATGQNRIKLAKESKDRKRHEAEELARRNAEMQARLAKVQSKTDDDVDDEAAGRRRAELAAASKARREAESERRREQNALIARRMAKTGAATDDDITDEATGRARVAWAAASEERRAERNRELGRSNAQMRRRIANLSPRVSRPSNSPAQRVHDTGSPLTPEEGFQLWDDAFEASIAADAARREYAQRKWEAERRLTADQLKMRRSLKSLSKTTPPSKTAGVTETRLTLVTDPSVGNRGDAYVRHTGLFTAALYRLSGYLDSVDHTH
uniref:Uncharacterized protein n=1 Tax=Haptolina brevifila TaxID=156173 RepID=A0A7S2FPK7_9EUKA